MQIWVIPQLKTAQRSHNSGGTCSALRWMHSGWGVGFSICSALRCVNSEEEELYLRIETRKRVRGLLQYLQRTAVYAVGMR